ncbi:MAG: guanylate kinase [Lentisphaerae bacterium]|nr:guanylate kinase [Lentisphaerota bacterium]
MKVERRSLLIVMSAPSGVGKTTLAGRLLAACPRLRRAVTCTTRSPRAGERDGRDYYFLTDGEFRRRLKRGAFLEHAEVHGARYGTLKREVLRHFDKGHDVLLVIDVQGARNIRRLKGLPRIRNSLVDVFIAPPSMTVLKRRLAGRGTESAAALRLRLRNARHELRCAKEFQYRVVNDRLEDTVAELKAIVREARRLT